LLILALVAFPVGLYSQTDTATVDPLTEFKVQTSNYSKFQAVMG
jgi:hypothetical protein